MRRFLLIGICLCASIIIFSQQAIANLVDMSPSVFASTFEQTGIWSMYPDQFSQSIGWPSSTANSWSYTPTSVVPKVTVVTWGIYTDTWTGASSTISFYYNGTEYTASSVGSDGITTLILNFSSWEDFNIGVFDSGSLDIKPQSGPMPIYTMDNNFTGFYLNDAEITGAVTNSMGPPDIDRLYGICTSVTGYITGTAVPEPATMLLLGLGLMGLAGVRRKFQK